MERRAASFLSFAATALADVASASLMSPTVLAASTAHSPSSFGSSLPHLQTPAFLLHLFGVLFSALPHETVDSLEVGMQLHAWSEVI